MTQQSDFGVQETLRSDRASTQSEQSLLCTQLVADDLIFLHAHSKE